MCAFCAFLHSSGHTLQQWLRPLLGHWQTAHRSCRRDFLICPCDRWFTLTCSQSSSQTSSSCQSASPLAPSWKHLPELKSNVPSDSSLQPTLGQRFFSVPPACKRNAVEWISPHTFAAGSIYILSQAELMGREFWRPIKFIHKDPEVLSTVLFFTEAWELIIDTHNFYM